MLEIAQADPVQTLDTVRRPGGFVWWYADLCTPDGEGVVVIWSLGLPFLSDLRPEVPAMSRPTVSVAHYRDGSQHFYLLQRYEEREAKLDVASGTGTIGTSSYQLDKDDNVSLRIVLDEPIPSTKDRLQAEILIHGPNCRLSTAEPKARQHVWSPLSLCATGRASLSYGGKTHLIEGGAYVDSNLSNVPLKEQGIHSWRWGRLSFPSRSVVFYEVEESAGDRLRFTYQQKPGERLTRLPSRLTFRDERNGKYGLSIPREVLLEGRQLSIHSTVQSVVEDGPFYARALLTAKDDRGESGFGFSEVVVPSKIDQPWQRPLIRMRTHRVGGENSVFLPLFNGPRSGRASRLFSSLQSLVVGS